MVALRGTKAKASAASRKAVEKTAAKGNKQKTVAATSASAALDGDSDGSQATQQLPDITGEERVQRLIAFATQAGLVLHRNSDNAGETSSLLKMMERTTVSGFLDAMLVAFCANGKDKTAPPQQILSRLTAASRKRVCGAIFSADEIAYSCRDCQIDSSCVICRDCFMHGDHVGHDVYFQRTTAGSSCDCGDAQAWKRTGFCTRHPGAEEEQDGASDKSVATKKTSLPKALASIAPVVIEAVVDFMFQVYLGIDQAFEFSEALEWFTRDLAPSMLTEMSESSRTPPAASTVTAASTSSGRDRRSSRHTSATSSSEESIVQADATSTNHSAAAPESSLFAIRVHNDDMHTMDEVMNVLSIAMKCSKHSARQYVSETDRFGDTVLAKLNLLKCAAPTGALARQTLNISVAPVWWEQQMETLPSILEWLRTISMASDGLYEIVSESLRKDRPRRLCAPASVSPIMKIGASSKDFWKQQGVRLHSTAQELIAEWAGSDEADLHDWTENVERAMNRLYQFGGETSDNVGAVTVPQSMVDNCENVLILEFVKSVCLTQAYSRHKSIRDACASLIERQSFVKQQTKPNTRPSSVLALMVRWDCALRKRTAHLGHALLREHMLNKRFRQCMLETYASSYGAMTQSYLKGLGNSTDSIFDFAVQFLTVPQLVKQYTRSEVEKDPSKPQLAYEILSSLKGVLASAVTAYRAPRSTSGPSVVGGQSMLNVEHPVLTSQKYKHCIDDLEYIFNMGSMPNELVCDQRNLDLWISSLKLIQYGDPQERRGIDKSHVEYESDSWLSMFNLGIRMHSIFPVAWNGISPDAMADRKGVVVRVLDYVVSAAIDSSRILNETTPVKAMKSIEYVRDPSSSEQSRVLQLYEFKVAAAPASLHFPLHRFLASSIRHVSIHVSWFQDVLESEGLLKSFALDKLSTADRFELVELPLRSVVMASQIHSNLWRRNGEENMMAQLYNYSALPCCVHFRDVDVFLLQVGVILLGPDAMLSLMVDRFQLGEFFLGPLAAASDELSPMAMGYSSRERGVDEQQEFQMVEELLRLVIVLGTSLPSSVGEAFEDSFLEEEMLQHLCAKSSSFSKLFDVAILPTGQDDVSVPRLEQVLSRVATFAPPTGLEPGRYELKEGLLDAYNPYFIHLNREAHELARDRWTNYRKVRRQRHRAASKTAPPIAPLQRMRRPLPFLRQARGILMCEGTLTLAHTILWKVAQDSSPKKDADKANVSGGAISDAVISTTLHLLVYGVYAAEDADEDKDSAGSTFWTMICQPVPALSDSSMVSSMWTLADSTNPASSSLDEEQSSTLQWLMWKISNCSTACSDLVDSLKKEKQSVNDNQGSSGNGASVQPALTLEQRKEDARKRALEAMARQQAAFQAMMANMDDEEDEEDDRDDLSSSRVEHESDDPPTENSALGKRRASTDGSAAEIDEVKRARLDEADADEDASCYKCILCHDTSKQGEMGVAAYVHQSTVLSGSFRPEPEEGLQPRGAEVRKKMKVLIEKMDLCSGTSEASSDSPSPAFRALAAQFPDWRMDDELDELLLDPPLPHLNLMGGAHRQIRHNNGTGGGIFADHDAALQALEGVLDLREDQRLFPLPIHGAAGVSPDRRDRGVQRPRGIIVARRGGPPVMDLDSDFDDDDEDDFDDEEHHDHHHHHHHHHHHSHSPRRSRSGSNTESVPLFLTPCGLHIRTCQHAVHIHCLERYIRSLHDKAIRGEDFDGVQAIDPDSAMTQFLCPLCKTLCNFLLPTSDPGGSGEAQPMAIENGDSESSSTVAWHAIVDQQLKAPGWYRSVFGRDGGIGETDGDSDIHDLWRDYFEETLWEPHGSLEKGAPFLWSACAFSLASFLNVAEEEFRNASGSSAEFDPLTDSCPAPLEKEFASLVDVTKFCRWSFSLLEHSGDAKVIWETSKRCCPINTETKREYRKFTKVLGSIDACLRGTILGLLVADTFTAFVVSSVIADSPSTIWQFIPVFSAADLMQRVYTEFFVQSKNDERSLLQDKFSIVDDDSASTVSVDGSSVGDEDEGRPRRRTRSSTQPSESSVVVKRPTKNSSSVGSRTARDTVEAMLSDFEDTDSDEHALLTLLLRILDSDPDEKLKPLTKKDLAARLQHIQSNNAVLVRRMKLFWRCLSNKEPFVDASTAQLQIPSLAEVAASPRDVFEQVWKWCVDRMNSKSFLGISKNGDKCEHAEGCGEGYIASMFILRDQPSRPRLIDLPVQYDVLYSMMSGRKCTRCDRTPCEPAICLICGEFLCCGDSCCTRPFVNHGPQVGECTRHAAECGGGIGIVLMLDQCRVAIIGGSMGAHFPSPYVDAHGEEDVGLQRGRPLRLDMVRYRHLESLWVNHRIFAEVSRQRNQREPQYTIGLSYL